jgi:CheY-like chemotaxis protein
MLLLPRSCHARVMAKRSPIKLLVVDDHAAFRATLRQMFEGLNVVIIEADSGEAALRLFAAEHPDWVIMDLRMPGMGGIKATEVIHGLDSSARIIVISQFTEPEWNEQARRAGATNFLSKEHLDQLVSIIERQSPLQP